MLGKWKPEFYEVYYKKWLDLYQYLGNDYKSLGLWLSRAGIKKGYPELDGRDMPSFFEKGEYKNVIAPMLDAEMKRRNQFFNVIPLEHGGRRKEARIRTLQPRFKTHSILFAEDQDWLPEMEAELLAFTMQGSKGLHDDLIDALAYGEQIAQTPYRPNKRNRNLPRMQEAEGSFI